MPISAIKCQCTHAICSQINRYKIDTMKAANTKTTKLTQRMNSMQRKTERKIIIFTSKSIALIQYLAIKSMWIWKSAMKLKWLIKKTLNMFALSLYTCLFSPFVLFLYFDFNVIHQQRFGSRKARQRNKQTYFSRVIFVFHILIVFGADENGLRELEKHNSIDSIHFG